MAIAWRGRRLTGCGKWKFGGTRLLAALAMLWASAFTASASPDTWRREGWKRTDFKLHAVDLGEIAGGGPSRDGIPALDDPKFLTAGQDSATKPHEPVISLELTGDARAYPLRILLWHEIAKDTVGGVPVVVTYCPLCNAAIVFERRVDGMTLTFGTTGKLRHSDLVMYDRQTESWWQQFTGDAIVGSLTGHKLRMLPARLEAFALFKERYPEGRVLVASDPDLRPYGRNPYLGYDTSSFPFPYKGEFRQGISPMARVVVIRENDKHIAVTLELLRQKRRIEIADFALSWREGQASALDRETVAAGRDVGNVIAQKAQSGRFEDIPYDVTFAFVFDAFHPGSEIIQTCKDDPGASSGAPPLGGKPAMQMRCAQEKAP
jgi:hypothetical protein